jgi:hypothetical protein
MATTQGPLMSLDASGTIAKSLTFAHWRGRKYVRQWVMPTNPNTPLQQGMRAMMQFLTTYWALFTAPQKAEWEAEGTGDNITGLNAFVRTNQTRVRQNEWPVFLPSSVAGAEEAAPANVTVVPGPGSLTVTWTDSVGANDWATLIFLGTTIGPDVLVQYLVRCVRKGVMTATITGLITGQEYTIILAGVEKGGTLGAPAEEETGTPT